jgi:hypothetical protein
MTDRTPDRQTRHPSRRASLRPDLSQLADAVRRVGGTIISGLEGHQNALFVEHPDLPATPPAAHWPEYEARVDSDRILLTDGHQTIILEPPRHATITVVDDTMTVTVDGQPATLPEGTYTIEIPRKK